MSFQPEPQTALQEAEAAAGSQAPTVTTSTGHRHTASLASASAHLPHGSLKASSTSQRQLTPLPAKPLPVSSSDHKAVSRGRSALHAPRRRLPQTCILSAKPPGPHFTLPERIPPLVRTHLAAGSSGDRSYCKAIRHNLDVQPQGTEKIHQGGSCSRCWAGLRGLRSPAMALTKRGGALDTLNFP